MVHNPEGDPKSNRPISLLCVPYKILERLISRIIHPLLPKSRLDFDAGSQPWIKLFCWPITLRILLRLRRPVLYLSIWQRLMTLSGTVALHASCWDYFRISTWLEWLWSLSESDVSSLLPVTASKAGYAVWKTASLIDWSWLPSFSTCICTTFPPQFPESLLMQTIWHCCILLEKFRTWRGLQAKHDCTFSVSPDLGV